MLQDLEKALPCEAEALSSRLYRASREAGAAAPVNDQVTSMIMDIQAGKLSCGFGNLRDVDLPDISFYFS